MPRGACPPPSGMELTLRQRHPPQQRGRTVSVLAVDGGQVVDRSQAMSRADRIGPRERTDGIVHAHTHRQVDAGGRRDLLVERISRLVRQHRTVRMTARPGASSSTDTAFPIGWKNPAAFATGARSCWSGPAMAMRLAEV